MNLIFLIISVASAMVSGCFFWLRSKRNGFVREIRSEVKRARSAAVNFEQRMNQLESHAVDYLLSVGTSGASELVSMKDTLARVDKVMAEVEGLLVIGDFAALGDALTLLSYTYDVFPEEKKLKAIESFPRADWEEHFESTLQSLGDKVRAASEIRSRNKISRLGQEKRKPTIATLYDIGVKTAIEQIRSARANSELLETDDEDLDELPRGGDISGKKLSDTLN